MDTSDPESDDSISSRRSRRNTKSRRANRKHMSILTNQYIDVPQYEGEDWYVPDVPKTRRKFFGQPPAWSLPELEVGLRNGSTQDDPYYVSDKSTMSVD
jgi:hypothetical protein